MSEPRALVEHFFRHEFGRLVAVLTRSLSVRRLALVEDVALAGPRVGGVAEHFSAFPCPPWCVCYAVEVAA